MTQAGSSHELTEHVGEVGLRIRAGSLGMLLAEAGRGLASLELGGAATGPPGEWRHITVAAGDRESLLVEWLNELIFLAESERWVATAFEVESAEPTRATLRARGVEVDRAPGLVKGATYHRLAVRDVPDGLEAEILLDV